MAISPGVERTFLAPGFRLAEWEVRPEDGSLRSPEADLAHRLEPLLMDLLVFLGSRAGQVVSKQELLEAVWGGRFVSDDTVKGSLYQLRKALGDDPRRPRFIETLPKRGYRLLVPPVPFAPPTPPSPEVSLQDLYAKGRAALSGQPGAAALQQARLYLERAVQSAPEHAAAWSDLARTYILMVLLGVGKSGDLLARARDAAARAVELDPERAEAHVALGAVRFLHEHDFAAAETELRRAIDLAPGEALSHRWLARLLSAAGRHGEAVAAARRALAADPLSLPVRRDLIEVTFLARRYEEALAEARQLFDIDPHLPDVQLGLVWMYAVQGKGAEASEAFQRGLELLGVGEPIRAGARVAFESGGLPALLRLWAELLEREAELGQKNQIDLLNLYALLGEPDRCFDLLERSAADGNPYLLWLPVSPLFDSLRGDPRYARILERLEFRAAD